MSARAAGVAVLSLAALGVAGCATGAGGSAGAAAQAGSAAPSARARLADAAGNQVGTATLTEVQDGVQIVLEVSGLTPGQRHGFHVHEAGRCDPPDFKTAGGHFNPTGRQHGLENPQGHHAGDLPNLEAGSDGRARTTAVAKGATLRPGEASLLRDGGTAIVVHAGRDDGRTDPAGDSGARIACGVIERG